MNLILLAPEECDSRGEAILTGRRARHVLTVLRSVPGDRLRVGVVDAEMGWAEVLECEPDRVRLQVDLGEAPPPKLPLSLVLALPRPKMLRRILRTVAELGVAELWLLNTWKVEKSYWQSPLLETDTQRDYLLEGLEQARDTVLPAVHCRRLFKPFVEDELPGLCRNRRALLAHPGAVAACPRSLREPATLAVGPEGGWTDYEVEALLAAGFESVGLGARILRVETAVTALISQVCAPQ